MEELGRCYNLVFFFFPKENKVLHIYEMIRNLGDKFTSEYKTRKTGQYPESDINCIPLDAT